MTQAPYAIAPGRELFDEIQINRLAHAGARLVRIEPGRPRLVDALEVRDTQRDPAPGAIAGTEPAESSSPTASGDVVPK